MLVEKVFKRVAIMKNDLKNPKLQTISGVIYRNGVKKLKVVLSLSSVPLVQCQFSSISDLSTYPLQSQPFNKVTLDLLQSN